MRGIFHGIAVGFRLTYIVALAFVIFLGGCTYLYAHRSELELSKLSNLRLYEVVEFVWARPDKPKRYRGPANARELMKALDDAYNKIHATTEVSIHICHDMHTSIYISNLTASAVNARYPRAEWLEILLDRGIIIDNLHKYAFFLSKRHALVLLEDNPNLRQSGLLDIPPTDGWKGYKEAYVNKLVKDHVKTRDAASEIERSKKKVEGPKSEIECSEAEIKRTKKVYYAQGTKRVLNTEGLEKVYLEFKYIQGTLEPTPTGE